MEHFRCQAAMKKSRIAATRYCDKLLSNTNPALEELDLVAPVKQMELSVEPVNRLQPGHGTNRRDSRNASLRSCTRTRCLAVELRYGGYAAHYMFLADRSFKTLPAF